MTDWTSIWRVARVSGSREVGRGNHLLSLRIDDEHPFPFQPGHVLSLRLAQPDGTFLRHPYTVALVNPEARELGLVFRIIPGGRLTPTLAALKQGAVEVSGLHHRPILDEISFNTDIFVGISTGSGIGPLYGFARWSLERGFKRSIRLFAGYREEADISLGPELGSLAERFPNFSWAPTLSRPAETWQGLRGRVTESVPALIANPLTCHFHLVGNKAMLEEMEAALTLIGVPDSQVSDEGFFNWNAEADRAVVQAIAGRFRV